MKRLDSVDKELKQYLAGLPRERKLIEMYRYVKSGQIATKKQLTDLFSLSEASIKNYFHSLNDLWQTIIEYSTSLHRFVVISPGKLKDIKSVNMLTPEQVQTIMFSLNKSSVFKAERIREIRDKLINLLPGKEQEILGRYLLDEDLGKGPESFTFAIEEYTNMIRDAILNKRKLELLYQGNSGSTRLIVLPYTFHYIHHRYYLIAQNFTDQEKNLLFLDTESIRMISDTCETVKNSDILSYARIQEFIKNTWYTVRGCEITVRIKMYDQCSELLSNRRGLINAVTVMEGNGYRIMDITSFGLDGIKSWLLGFGDGIEVISPKELKDEMMATAQNMIRIYG